MINYGDIELTDIAPVKIEDVVVSPIRMNAVARQRAVKFGEEYIRMTGSTRTVTVTFALLEIDTAERESAMDAIRTWAFSEVEKKLSLPQFEDRYLECVCTQMPDHSYRKWWESKLKIIFTCFNNPYWNSNELIEVPCGNTFSIGGSAQPLMTIERTGSLALTNQTYSNQIGGVMTFSRVPAGSLVIDLNRQTAAVGGSSIMAYYSPSSVWITPRIGANQVITGAGVIKYRERWV